MSKRLPYYQSEPAEYLAGDIMFCSYAAQGVFSIIRALYWQKDCNLTLNQIKRRCKGADELINELIDEDIIKINGQAINIDFLDEQFDKATNRAKTNSENGKKGAAARWKNSKDNSESIATPLKTDGESIALREDKIKEDKIITTKEVDLGVNDLFKNTLLKDSYVLGEYSRVFKTNVKTIKHYINLFRSHLITTGETKENQKDYQVHFGNWLRRQQIQTIKEKAVNPYKNNLVGVKPLKK
jgi:hypothetical protein